MRKRKNGFSLVEVIVLLVVISIAAAPMTALLYQTLSDRADATMQIMATSLAKGVMEEILSKAFEDPDGSPGSFGTEEGSRINYDDVDDYDGLNETPPRDSQGNALTSFSGFRTQVAVQNVAAASPGGSAETDGSTDFKRVTVTVSWNNAKKLVRLLGLSSSFGDSNSSPQSGLTFIERRSSHDKELKFRVRNDTGDDLYFTHLIASWNSPTAYYEKIEIKAIGYADYHAVWEDSRHNDIRMSNGGTAMFNKGGPVFVPSGTTMEIKLKEFHNNKHHGSERDMSGTSFTIEMWAAPDKYIPFTVPPQ